MGVETDLEIAGDAIFAAQAWLSKGNIELAKNEIRNAKSTISRAYREVGRKT